MSEELGSAGQPKGLLEQMEELMAALNADLSELADLHAAGTAPAHADDGGTERSGQCRLTTPASPPPGKNNGG
jgi:hypothetical protein